MSVATQELDLTCIMKTVLTTLFSEHDSYALSQSDIDELLRDDEQITKEKAGDPDNYVGYPVRPLYKEIGRRLDYWLSTGTCPLDHLPVYSLLDETEYITKRNTLMQEVSTKLQRIKTLHSVWSLDELHYAVKEILTVLGKRGLLDLLGMRKTVGTADIWPPSWKVLEETFCEKHSPDTNSPLSVGARALAKHCHRDHSSWWGTSSGSEASKNDHAHKKMTEILKNATWINIHELPPDLLIIEAREEHGYGARWTADGRQFRGFLEPQMVNGHEVGWKH